MKHNEAKSLDQIIIITDREIYVTLNYIYFRSKVVSHRLIIKTFDVHPSNSLQDTMKYRLNIGSQRLIITKYDIYP